MSEWTELLNEILWAYRTTTKTLIGEILFLLTYGTEAIIPTEIGCLSARVLHFSPQNNKQGLIFNLELLEEPILIAAIRNEACKHKATQYYNTRVKKTEPSNDETWY
jgi:hypothetical protein